MTTINYIHAMFYALNALFAICIFVVIPVGIFSRNFRSKSAEYLFVIAAVTLAAHVAVFIVELSRDVSNTINVVADLGELAVWVIVGGGVTYLSWRWTKSSVTNASTSSRREG